MVFFNGFVNSGSTRIHYSMWKGGGTKAPLICIPGITANSRFFDCLAESLSDERTVVSYDLRGRGDSDKPPQGYSLEIHARDLKNLIEQLGFSNVNLLGHSMGATLVSYFLANHDAPVAKAVLVDGGTDFPSDLADQIRPALDRLGTVFNSLDDFLNLMKKIPYLHPWTVYHQSFYSNDVRVNPDGTAVSKISKATILEELDNLFKVNIREILPRIRQEVLLLRAPLGMAKPDDVILPEKDAEEIVSLIPSCRRVDIPGANHISIMLAESPEANVHIKEFLNN